MSINKIPEIFCSSLSSIVLNFVQKGIDILNFYWIDQPKLNDIQSTLDELVILGALENNSGEIKLTKLGEFISKIQVEPKVGKVIFSGYTNGFLQSALYLAAAIEASGSIWFHFNQLDKQKKLSLLNKNCSIEYGDIIPLIPILKEFEKNKFDQQWCKTRQLHFKFCGNAIIMKDEVRDILQREGYSVKDLKTPTQKDYLQILLTSFPMNICVAVKEDYRSIFSSVQGSIDKSSVVCELETPRYLLFQEVFTFSTSFFCRVTPIPQEMLSREVMGSSFEFYQKSLSQNFSQEVITGVTPSVLQNTFGKNNNMLSVIEKITSSTIDIQTIPNIKIIITSKKENVQAAKKFILERIDVTNFFYFIFIFLF